MQMSSHRSIQIAALGQFGVGAHTLADAWLNPGAIETIHVGNAFGELQRTLAHLGAEELKNLPGDQASQNQNAVAWQAHACCSMPRCRSADALAKCRSKVRAPWRR